MKKIFSLFAAVLFAGSMFAADFVKTAYEDLKSGDVVIVTMAKDGNVYAASNENGTSSAPAAVAVTVAEDKISTDATDILWTVTKNGDNIQFGVEESFMYCTNTNNGVRVGSNTNNVFSIKDAYLYNNGQGRYIGVYNAQDWRCYTTINANIKDQTLAFYALDGEIPQVEEFYLVGSFCGWERSAEYKLAANKEAEGEYMIRLDIPANSKMKVQGVLGEVVNWYPDGVDNDFVINDEGDYTIYFRPAGDGDQAAGWHYGYIFAVYHEPIVVTNCATAREAALSVASGEYYKEDEKEVFTIRGYVTKIEVEYNDTYHNISFWMADAADGGEVIEAYRAACASAEAAPEVGNYVELTGKIKNYKGTPEFDAGCEFTILETPTAVDNTEVNAKAVKFFENGQLVIIKNGVKYNATGAIVK